MSVTLTFTDIVQANRENIDKIGAFNGRESCQYDYRDSKRGPNGLHCAIGVALPPGTVPRNLQTQIIDAGVMSRYVEFASDKDRFYARTLQQFHDDICLKRRKATKEEYLDHLDTLLTDYTFHAA